MTAIRVQVNEEMRGFGIAVEDVRIRRADLPEENTQAILSRMQSERERIARQARAEGAEASARIRANAERDRTVLLAEARAQADRLRGEGEQQASRTYAHAYQQDPSFFSAWRTLQAYRDTFAAGGARLVLTSDNDFLRLLQAGPSSGASASALARAGRRRGSWGSARDGGTDEIEQPRPDCQDRNPAPYAANSNASPRSPAPYRAGCLPPGGLHEQYPPNAQGTPLMRLTSTRTVRAAALAFSALLAVPAASGLSAVPAYARDVPDSFADLAEKLQPAVVNISSSTSVQARGGFSGPEIPLFPPGSPFEQFFKDFLDRNRPGGRQGQPTPQQPAPERRMQSLGSGFIVDPSGLVVTNNHVIEGADEVTVTLQDNTSLKATIVGRDERVDVALLKVKSDKPLPAVSFGDSDKERVGDWVLAIGNPFGLGGSVTAGIVSARGRDIRQGPYDDFLQTDAAINRGNSGGPLFNMNGEVIGINTAIYSPSGGSIGIGFAIPANMAKTVVDQLRDFGHARRGWLGVRIQQVTPDIAESLGLHDSGGCDGRRSERRRTRGSGEDSQRRHHSQVQWAGREGDAQPAPHRGRDADRTGSAGDDLARWQAADRAGQGR